MCLKKVNWILLILLILVLFSIVRLKWLKCETVDYIWYSYIVYSQMESNVCHDEECPFLPEHGNVASSYAWAEDDGMIPCFYCRPGRGYYVVCNTQDHVFHDSSCPYVPGPKNETGITLRYETAVSKYKYTPCPYCNPEVKGENKMYSLFSLSPFYMSCYDDAFDLAYFIGTLLGAMLIFLLMTTPSIIVFLVRRSNRKGLWNQSKMVRVGMHESDAMQIMSSKHYSYSRLKDGVGCYTYTAREARGYLNLFAVPPLKVEIEVKDGFVVSVKIIE